MKIEPHAAAPDQLVQDLEHLRAARSRRAPRSVRPRSAVPARAPPSWRSSPAGPCRRRVRADRGRRRARGARICTASSISSAFRRTFARGSERSPSADRLGDLRADAHDRVEREFRILQDHAHAVAAQLRDARAARPSVRSMPANDMASAATSGRGRAAPSAHGRTGSCPSRFRRQCRAFPDRPRRTRPCTASIVAPPSPANATRRFFTVDERVAHCAASSDAGRADRAWRRPGG
jgi:hypothetical protein